MIMTALLCACGTSEARQSSGEQTTEAAENATARADAGQGGDADADTAQMNTGQSGDVGTSAAQPDAGQGEDADATAARANTQTALFTQDTTVGEVIHDPAFGDFGRLLFPVDRYISEDMTLADISSSDVYVWYSNIDADKTVEIVNNLKTRAENGEQVFYNIYSDDEIEEDASRADTGLFFLRVIREQNLPS